MLDLKTRKPKASPPTARNQARMVAFAKKNRFPPYAAEMLATMMTPETAEQVEADLVTAFEFADAMKVTLENDLTPLLQKAIDAFGEEMDSGDEESDNSITAHLAKAINAKRVTDDPFRGKSIVGASRAHMGQDWNSPAGQRAKIADAFTARLSARLGQQHEPTIGREYAELTIPQMAVQSLIAVGERPMNEAEAVRTVMSGSHTTSDFPLAIEAGLTGVVGKGVATSPPALMAVSAENDAVDYREGSVVSLSASAMPGKVPEGGDIEHVTINENGERKPVPEDHAAIFRISNQAMQNDSTALGLFADIGRKMIDGATGRLRQVLNAPLLANGGLGQTMRDGNPMFHVDHGNLAETPSGLDVAGLTAARTVMRRKTGSQGELLAIEPKFLIVPPELETAGQKVLADLMAAKVDDVNPFAGKLELVVEPGLASETAWYLAADPMMYDGLAHAFLDGGSAPRIESRVGWNTLGMEFRLVWSIGAAFTGYHAWYLDPGA
ncbi:MAG: Mu-like prophage major head subunit gpT family protein [Pseudomonadota bacterium]